MGILRPLPDILFTGDSQPGNLIGTRQAPVNYLRQYTRRTVRESWVGGETSAATAARVTALTPENLAATTLIWTCHNDNSDPTHAYAADIVNGKANVAAIIAALGHTNFLVLSLVSGPANDRAGHADGWNARKTINDYWATTYGQKYLDLQLPMVYYDLTDSAAMYGGYIPAVLQNGAAPSHPNAIGNAMNAHAIANRLADLGI